MILGSQKPMSSVFIATVTPSFLMGLLLMECDFIRKCNKTQFYVTIKRRIWRSFNVYTLFWCFQNNQEPMKCLCRSNLLFKEQ